VHYVDSPKLFSVFITMGFRHQTFKTSKIWFNIDHHASPRGAAQLASAVKMKFHEVSSSITP
jgi:hypothetical protein